MYFNLRAPLALDAGIGRDFAVPAVQQGLQSVDLAFVVDVDFEGELGAVASVRPGGGGSRCGGGGEGKAVEEAGEEEGGGDEG